MKAIVVVIVTDRQSTIHRGDLVHLERSCQWGGRASLMHLRAGPTRMPSMMRHWVHHASGPVSRAQEAGRQMQHMEGGRTPQVMLLGMMERS